MQASFNALPFQPKTIHFVGIGGIGMSGLAALLKTQGYMVQGSDVQESAYLEKLRIQGIECWAGHRPEQLGDAELVVLSSAIKADNAEVVAAQARHIPIISRGDLLAAVMRTSVALGIAGSHGKTTTSSMLGWVLHHAGLDPTIITGGIMHGFGSNIRVGQSQWLVVETDESDGSFLQLPTTIGAITNIDPEHLDHYGSFAALKAAYAQFIQQLPFYGFAVLCSDNAEVAELAAAQTSQRVVTYGFSEHADVHAKDIQQRPDGFQYTVKVNKLLGAENIAPLEIFLPMHGQHNVQNSLAVIAIALALGLSADAIQAGLASFGGVKRRFTITGKVDGITVVDDYGHHPTEIAAVLKAARQVAGDKQVIAVFQPHRYTRVRDLFHEFTRCFAEADRVVVSEIYAASEAPIAGITREALVDGIKAQGQANVMALSDPARLAASLKPHLQAGDYIICLGAGTITQWAHALPQQLQDLQQAA